MDEDSMIYNRSILDLQVLYKAQNQFKNSTMEENYTILKIQDELNHLY